MKPFPFPMRAACFIFLLFSLKGLAQVEKISDSLEKQSFIYSVKDTNLLGLDVYNLKGFDSTKLKPAIIFVFGGAFVGGHRNDSIYNKYFNQLVEHGFTVVPITYRLGLKGVKGLSVFNIGPLKHAIDLAVEDVYDATVWIIGHAKSFGIDTARIIISGSSSGAITVLESDYKRRNHESLSKSLPANFEYAGVIAFSGAILSFNWGLKYHMPPAPTLMFHGTADRIVPYNKIRFLNKGLFGSAWISKTFQKGNYPFYFYSIEGMGHEISVTPMYDKIPVILDFLDRFVIQQKPYQITTDFKDPDAKPMLTMSAKELFEKLNR